MGAINDKASPFDSRVHHFCGYAVKRILRRIVNGALILLAPTASVAFDKWKQQHNRLPPGVYQIKVYIDNKNQLAGEPTAFLSSKQLVGEITVSRAKWQVGFPKAEWVSGTELTK